MTPLKMNEMHKKKRKELSESLKNNCLFKKLQKRSGCLEVKYKGMSGGSRILQSTATLIF